MGNESMRKKRYFKLILLIYSLIGVCFSAFGIWMIVMSVKQTVDCVKTSSFDAGVIFSALMAVAFSIFGGFGLYKACKYIYNWTMYNRTNKNGEVFCAEIIKWKEVSENRIHSGKNWEVDEKYYGCELTYDKDGERKYGKTDVVYNKNEMEYLRLREKIKIKVYKDYVVIVDFPDEIYAINLNFRRGLLK